MRNIPAASIAQHSAEMLLRYEMAKTLLQGRVNPIVPNSLIFPVWIKDSNCFWYERQTSTGKEFRLVNAELGSSQQAFNHRALANLLSEAVGEQVSANRLPINDLNSQATNTIEITLNPLTVRFTAFGKRWQFIDQSQSLKEIEQLPINYLISPNGQQVVFSRDYNLWVKDVDSHQERVVTTDGKEDFQYAIPGSVYGNDQFIHLLALQAAWSPDSRYLFTVQLDQRKVKSVVDTTHVPTDGSLRPQTISRKLAFPEDTQIEMYRLLIIDVASGKSIEPKYHQIPPVRGGSGGFFENTFGWWSSDSKRAYFIDVDRYYKRACVIEVDPASGDSKVLFEEHSATRIDLTMGPFDRSHHIPLPATQELLWYSERSGWAHFYLYDLVTGKLKNVVTQGNWVVRDVIRFDAKRREIFITTSGRDKERDPYFRDLVRVNIDTGEMTTLAASDHEYITASSLDITQFMNGYVGTSCGVSPSGNYAVVTRSRVDQMPVSYLVDRQGVKILDLETPTCASLPQNWRWPEPVKLKAADGISDIYAVLYRPSDFSPNKSYPIIDQSFVGYPSPIAAKGAFANSFGLGAMFYEAAALAELGFIVIQIDGRGSCYRSKSFMDESYGWSNAMSHIDDHVAGITQLADRYTYIDLNRVGVCGFHMGGNGVLEGLLKYPDFYRVGVAGQLYDSRLQANYWADFYEGPTPTANEKYPEELVHNLKGKMLLMVGLQDYFPPAITFRLVEALQKANKDFDLIVEPNWGYTSSVYQVRRGWDYLIQHLKGEKPPKEFDL